MPYVSPVIQSWSDRNQESYRDVERLATRSFRAKVPNRQWQVREADKWFEGSIPQAMRQTALLDNAIPDSDEIPPMHQTRAKPNTAMLAWIHSNIHLEAKHIAHIFNCSTTSAKIARDNPPPVTNPSTPSIRPMTALDTEYIATHHQATDPKLLAIAYGVSLASIYAAKRSTLKLPPRVSQGPLSYIEKCIIREDYSDAPATLLAKEYNTSAANVRIAQRGDFKDSPDIRHSATLPIKARLEALTVACTLLGCTEADLLNPLWSHSL